ncbi:hypothetical protein SprV_0501824100 [Sparganum proliferum]
MSRNLGADVISPHRRCVFGHSRSELSSGFSDVVASSATAPDPINDSRRFLPRQRVFRFHYQTPDGCLRSVCNSNPKWCEKAADSFRNALDIWKRSPNFGVRAVRPFVPFAYAPVDEVARVAIGLEYPSESTTIFAAYEDIQEGQLVILFLLHRELNIREDGVEMFFECQRLIPFDDDEALVLPVATAAFCPVLLHGSRSDDCAT